MLNGSSCSHRCQQSAAQTVTAGKPQQAHQLCDEESPCWDHQHQHAGALYSSYSTSSASIHVTDLGRSADSTASTDEVAAAACSHASTPAEASTHTKSADWRGQQELGRTASRAQCALKHDVRSSSGDGARDSNCSATHGEAPASSAEPEVALNPMASQSVVVCLTGW